MIRIPHATWLESFRLVCTTDWKDPKELEASIRGEPYEVNWQAEAGTAWHAVLERPISDTIMDGYCHWEGWLFHPDDVAQAQRHIGEGIRELRSSKVYRLSPYSVEVSGKCDHMHGRRIQDSKTKFTTADARDYEQSLQWRFYLSIFGAHEFRYNLFRMRQPKDGFCELEEVTSFSFWSYPNMEADLSQWLRRFVHWCEEKDLLKHLMHQAA